MTREEIKEIKDLPGIYYIRNVVNGKYYIGQSIFVRRRLYHHLSNFNNNRYDAPLYKAMNKYGLDKFEIGILELFDTTDFTYIKPILDDLEKKYIQEYNSYGKTGYNQTLGGDAGVLGYKMTDEQRQRVSTNSKHKGFSKSLYVYDINTKCTYFAISIRVMSQILEGNPRSTRSQLSRNLDQHKIYKHYIVVSSKDMLTEEYISSIKRIYKRIGKHLYSNSGQYNRKYKVDEYYIKLKEIQKDEYMPSQKDIRKALGLCRKTICNYNNELRKKGLIKTVSYHKNILL